jgi:protein phosphatase
MSPSGAGTRRIHVSVFGETHIGRVRAENQDSLLVADLGRAAGQNLAGAGGAAGGEPACIELGPEGALLLVADGMGGAAGGSTASRLAVSVIHEHMLAHWSAVPGGTPERFALCLCQALEAAGRHIHEAGVRDSRYHGMGTTATLAGLLLGHAYFAQVGDSRAYVLRAGSAVQVTRDQSLVQDFIDAGMLTEDEARTSAHRGQVLQALGVGAAVRPHMTFHELRRDDVVLLCSDGLSRVVEDAEMAAIADGAPDPAVLCHRLIEAANARGGPDNITVVAARAGGDGLAAPGRDAVTRTTYTVPSA